MAATQHILLNEKELFSQMARGSEAAFTEIFEHYSQRIYSFVLKKTKSETMAEDVVQDVFMNLWAKREKITEVNNFESYIYMMATNKTFDHLKKIATDSRKIETLYARMKEMREGNAIDEMMDIKEGQAMINEAVAQLPAQRKKIYLMSRQQGMNYDEIADELNISRNTVSNQLVDALKYIREHVKKSAGAAGIPIMIVFKLFH
ncbi:MAG: RNA polymerase sigma-70 factor [Chitinophagaceae bacterium]